jgi:very-short-patch-repair endonuclease
MKLSVQSIDALVQIVTGNSELAPYRTGHELKNFFFALGVDADLGWNAGSRQKFVEAVLLEINGQTLMRDVIEAAVDSRNFIGTELDENVVIDYLNGYLLYDGFKIVRERIKNRVFDIADSMQRLHDVKNLIFASNGPKPDLVLNDALTNDIKILKNAEYCLIYDQEIGSTGLLWQDLVIWWVAQESASHVHEKAEYTLYYRLMESLNSEPEKLFFETYFKRFRRELDDRFPALIPQVYLHYDPKTIRELQGQKRLMHQRMDFLLLFSNDIRIVIEIDGQQHYSEDNSPSPKKYAEMVAEDRKLRLAGYEIYRFGGYELYDDKGRRIVETFFKELFKKYGI